MKPAFRSNCTDSPSAPAWRTQALRVVLGTILVWAQWGCGDGNSTAPDSATGTGYGRDPRFEGLEFLGAIGLEPDDPQVIHLPDDLAVGSDGSIFVLLGMGPSIRHYTSDFQLLKEFNLGTIRGNFDVAPDGSIVATVSRMAMWKYSATGERLYKWEATANGSEARPHLGDLTVLPDGSAAVVDDPNRRVIHIGVLGDVLGQWGGDATFGSVDGVAADSRGRLYVLDAARSCIHRFDEEGQFLDKVTWERLSGSGPDLSVDEGGNCYTMGLSADGTQALVLRVGFEDESRVAHILPRKSAGGKVFAGRDGNLYVMERLFDQIRELDSSGNTIDLLGVPRSDPRRISVPTAVVGGVDGRIYVAESGNRRISIFSATGDLLTAWGYQGGDPDQLSDVKDMDVDDAGRVLIVGEESQVLSPTGQLLAILDAPWRSRVGAIDRQTGVISVGSVSLRQFRADGTVLGEWQPPIREGAFSRIWSVQFTIPGTVLLNYDHSIYHGGGSIVGIEIFDWSIQEFSPAGVPGKVHTTEQDYQWAVMDPAGRVFAAWPHGLVLLGDKGERLAEWGSDPKSPDRFGLISDVYLDDRGRLLIADKEKNQILIFKP